MDMFVLSVTGGLGAGKSTACEFFASRGARVISLDAVAKDVLTSDSGVREAVTTRFGVGVLGPDGRVDRAALAAAAFGDKDAASALNEIVHPAAIARAHRLLCDVASEPDAPALVVLEVPLLAEAPALLDLSDAVLAIASDEEARVARAVLRGMSEPDARRRIARQASDEDRAALATAVIVNDCGLGEFEGALEEYYATSVAPRLAGSSR